MTNSDITYQRLRTQQIVSPTFEKPGEVVRWLGAVQAQDYLGSLWAVGLRMRPSTKEAIEGAIAERKIIRTWPMRGTLHFVVPEDVRWMLKLLAPRVVRRNTKRLRRQYGIDEAEIERGREALQDALQGGNQLSRTAMYQVLEAVGISAENQRGLHILWWLAQEGVLCFGAREGRQPTFALLDEWAPPGKTLEGSEAFAELARRYFTSHGPATLQDFMWWTGLTKAEASTGLMEVKSELANEVYEDQEYWRLQTTPAIQDRPLSCYLLPPYDEYLVGYTDRRAAFRFLQYDQVIPGYGIISPTILIDGQVVGTWKRTIKKDRLVIKPGLFKALSKSEKQALAEAVDRYGQFIGLPVVMKDPLP